MAEAHARAWQCLAAKQGANGAFAGEVIWNTMLVCQYVVVAHVVGHPIAEPRRARIRRSIEHQRRPDGGWGMHPDGPSYLFHTVLVYVALRLLGHGPDDPLVAEARTFIGAHGGPARLPTWGQVWLAILGLYPWEATQPIAPELWLLPDDSPMHPRRLYCHMRLIYLGISYLWGARVVAAPSPILDQLRNELHPGGYDPGRLARDGAAVAESDLYERPNLGLRTAFAALRTGAKLVPSLLRRRALERALEHILFEFRSTGSVCLSPVNGLLFTLALHSIDPAHPELPKALAGLEYWFWEDEVEGLRIAGAKSDIWDTAFVLQALAAGPPVAGGTSIAGAAASWLAAAQIQREIIGGAQHYRSPAYGGWGFADEHHPWPVSDCTAEALEALVTIESARLADGRGRLDLGRRLAAIEFVLLRQNDDGGFGSYESRRGPMLLRHFNPAEIYGNCMVEYSYTECTASCVRALAFMARVHGEPLPVDLRLRMQRAVSAGCEFLLAAQAPSGAWAGFWGINFTYGCYFAVSALLEAGTSPTHPAIARACRFLVEHQRPDGGWGEDWRGMLDGTDVPIPDHEPSVVVQTAWALATLLAAAPNERAVIDRGIAFLLSRQAADGSWPRERSSGCFFNTAVLDYALYKYVFPTWVLGRWLVTFGGQSSSSSMSI